MLTDEVKVLATDDRDDINSAEVTDSVFVVSVTLKVLADSVVVVSSVKGVVSRVLNSLGSSDSLSVDNEVEGMVMDTVSETVESVTF